MKVTDKLIEKHKGLVYSIINKISRPEYIPQEDVKQEGFIGLVLAIKRFDSKKGTQFSTYAYAYVTGYVRHYIQNNRSLITGLHKASERVPKRNRVQWVEEQAYCVTTNSQDDTSYDINDSQDDTSYDINEPADIKAPFEEVIILKTYVESRLSTKQIMRVNLSIRGYGVPRNARPVERKLATYQQTSTEAITHRLKELQHG